MRDAIAGAWLYSLILVFVVILVAFIAISINYNKKYKLKTTVVNIIEEYQGVNPESVKKVGGFLASNAFKTERYCNKVVNKGERYIGITDGKLSPMYESGSAAEKTAKPQQVCISREAHTSNYDGKSAYTDYYYNIYMSFDFSLPVFGDIFKFSVNGSTNAIYYPVDTNNWGN